MCFCGHFLLVTASSGACFGKNQEITENDVIENLRAGGIGSGALNWLPPGALNAGKEGRR